MTITYGSLFSGIGGFDLAFDRVGMECRWQVEKDCDCLSVLHRHWLAVPKYEDVCTVGQRNLEPVDIICGGWPCQDTSVAGLRKGLSGARSGLFFEAVRIVGELRPALVLLENVPGLLSSHHGRDFSSVLMALHELGASDIAWRTLDAQYTGVPQRRRRVFLVADFRAGGEGAGEILFEPASVPWHSPQMRKARSRVAAGLTADSSGSGVNRAGRRREDDENLVVVGTLQGGGKRGHRIDTESAAGAQLVAYQCQGSNVGPMGTLRRGTGNETGGVNRTRTEPGLPASTLASGSSMHVPESVSLRGREGDSTAELDSDQASALRLSRGGGDQAYALTHHRVRRLMPVECERLMGLPDHWTRYRADGTELSDSARYRMIGNAVALPVVTWIAHRIVALLTCAEQEARA